MKKIFLGAFILFDVILIGASTFILVMYFNRKMPNQPSNSPTTSGTSFTGSKQTGTTSAVKTGGTGLLAPSTPAESGTRKILFSYRNPHSKHVSIRADFTGWKGEPMQKAANGNWTYQAQLVPGEYAYCYTADDKTFKDPANKRTKQIGRTLVSAIVVELPKPTK
jgi:hypothetical protein